MGIGKKGSIFLCDTPGFDDTNGPEVDIANGYGLVNLIKSCKSVRPSIIISAEDYAASRMQGLKNLVHILIGMLTEPQDHISFFHFF